MKILDRYASAVSSTNLASDHHTTWSDTDVLGAVGIADRRLSAGEGTHNRHPLAVPLQRLFLGDNAAAREIVLMLADMLRDKAPSLRLHLTEIQANDMAMAVLAWFRHPACRPCSGHGFDVVPNTTRLSAIRCQPCAGSGVVRVELAFRVEYRGLIRWAIDRMEREAGQAGTAAMKALCPQLDL